jgi:transcription elongation factor/antiterminator RfaH
MNLEPIWDVPRWFVIHTHPKQEYRAESNLNIWRVETFSPKFKQRRTNQFTSKPTFLTKFLFPGYIFARFKVNDLYHKVRYTRGVHSLVSFTNYPAPVSDEVIDAIKSRIMEDGMVRIGDEFRPGDEVLIDSGPFKDFKGIFQRGMKDADRVRVLLQTVNYQACIIINRESVRKVNDSEMIR